jgi:hypothetical protein
LSGRVVANAKRDLRIDIAGFPLLLLRIAQSLSLNKGREKLQRHVSTSTNWLIKHPIIVIGGNFLVPAPHTSHYIRTIYN